jgi:hypothetical protein
MEVLDRKTVIDIGVIHDVMVMIMCHAGVCVVVIDKRMLVHLPAWYAGKEQSQQGEQPQRTYPAMARTVTALGERRKHVGSIASTAEHRQPFRTLRLGAVPPTPPPAYGLARKFHEPS